MPVRIVLAAVVAMSFAPSALAEEAAPAASAAEKVPQHALSFTPLLALGPLLGVYPIAFEYEAATSDSFSVYVSPGYAYFQSPSTGWTVGLALGVRWYVDNGLALRGAWVGGDVSAGVLSGGMSAGPVFGISAMAGYNFLLGAFEISPGLGYSLSLLGGSLTLRLNVGYAF